MLIGKISYEDFLAMYKEFTENSFEFTIENPDKLYHDYLTKGTAINVWRKGFPLLRMEIKLAKSLGQKMVLNNPIKVHFDSKEILFCQIEAQIAYKRYISASEKDLEDARHLEIVFEGLKKEKIKYYNNIFEKDED